MSEIKDFEVLLKVFINLKSEWKNFSLQKRELLKTKIT
jgi:hypothetical protein